MVECRSLPVGAAALSIFMSPLGCTQSIVWSEVQAVSAEKSNRPDDNQIEGDNVIGQSGYDQDQNSGNQRYQRRETEAYVDGRFNVLSIG